MSPRLSAPFVAAIALLIAPNVSADDLVLELTTKLGVEKTVTVAKVEPVANGDATASRLALVVPAGLHESDKKFLALAPPSDAKLRSGITHPAMLVAIPWSAIKHVGFEKGISTVVCLDGGKFTGAILTEVTNPDGQKYHLGDCTKLVLKKVTKVEKKDVPGPRAKCTVQFEKLTQSFEARHIGYRTFFGTSEKFEMKVAGENTAGNLSDFEKVIVQGTGARPIKITVQAPKGKQIEGELVTIGNSSFILEDSSGCAVVLSLRDAFSPREAAFRITIEAAKAD